mmetsp:Transcript_136005/g.290741  ORF Transcript_136005/g.290741 Transcript_136005/m.290741 type:complete len:406 (-) Transcript_136005:79-1296(-)
MKASASKRQPTADQLAIILGIAAFAQLGALLRHVLTSFSEYNATNMSSAMWANILGCFIIGLLNGLKPVFDEKDLLPLFNAASVGFCGALTTFSTWQSEVARWLVLWPNPTVLAAFAQRHAFDRILSALSALLTELAIACLAYRVGRGVAHLIEGEKAPLPLGESDAEKQPLSSQSTDAADMATDSAVPTWNAVILPVVSAGTAVMVPLVRLLLGEKAFKRHREPTSCEYLHGNSVCHLDSFSSGSSALSSLFVVFLFILCVVTALVAALDLSLGTGVLFFIVICSPPGALLRYFLGKWFNKNPPGMGTFLANILATAVVGVVMVCIATNGGYQKNQWMKSLLKAISVGFCGSLSTLSTFVAQLQEFSFGEALIYFIVSIVVAQGVLCAILGVYLGVSGASSVCA